VTLMVFFAMRILPGDPIYMIMTSGEMSNVTEEQIQAMRHEFGLDRPMMLQYISWMGGIFRGDFGTSITQRRSPKQMIASSMPITLNLSLVAFVVSMVLGIQAGVICASGYTGQIRRHRPGEPITIPIFWLGTMLIYLFSLQLHVLPVQGYTSPFTDLVKNVRQLIMPVFCLAIFPLASITRQTRSSMLEVMRQDYIRTAWSKGLKERMVVMKHALKNGLIPVVTLSGMGLSIILGGSVLIETVFNIQGVGQTVVNAVFAHDYPVVQGFIFFIAIGVLFINFAVDISYGWLDPRIRYG
jgi:peptide/nickel transport system permease protein